MLLRVPRLLRAQAAYYNMPNSPAGQPMYYAGSPGYLPAAYAPGPQMGQYPPGGMAPPSMYPGGHQYHQPQHPGAPRMPGYPPAAKLYGQKGYGDFQMPAGTYPFGAAPYGAQGAPGASMHQPPMAGMQPPFPGGGYDTSGFNGGRSSYGGGYEGIGAEYHNAQQQMYMQGPPSGIFPPNTGL